MKERYPVAKYIAYYQPHSPDNMLGFTRQIGQTHRTSCARLLDVSACLTVTVA